MRVSVEGFGSADPPAPITLQARLRVRPVPSRTGGVHARSARLRTPPRTRARHRGLRRCGDGDSTLWVGAQHRHPSSHVGGRGCVRSAAGRFAVLHCGVRSTDRRRSSLSARLLLDSPALAAMPGASVVGRVATGRERSVVAAGGPSIPETRPDRSLGVHGSLHSRLTGVDMDHGCKPPTPGRQNPRASSAMKASADITSMRSSVRHESWPP